MKAIVVGGGIGGLTLALALRQAGHDVAFACAASFCSTVEAVGFQSFPCGLDWLESEAEVAFPALQQMVPHEASRWFLTDIFAGHAARRFVPDLLALADALIELKAVCECGRKATMNLRIDELGHAVPAGAQTEIGGNDRYVALCRKHFFERLKEAESRQVSLKLPN